jgi:hypothetical protein
MLGPATWLGLSLADSARLLSARLSDGTIAIPAPPETVKTWPVIGNNAYEIWQLASTNLRQVLVQAAPQFKPLGAGVLATAGSVGVNLLKFIVIWYAFIGAVVHSSRSANQRNLGEPG